MKTNQILTRKMGELPVEQRTKDGMFNATNLIKAWNLNTQNSGYVKKDLDDYFSNKSTQEYITTIMEREGKDKALVFTKSRARADRGGGTWMHPMLFLDFAMWLNPSFKYDVLKFVQDQLIAFRNEAGDAYKQLSTAVASISSKDRVQKNIQYVAKALNHIIYNQHEQELRNKIGDEKKMRELMEFEKHVAQLINEHFLTKFYDKQDPHHSLLTYLRDQWAKRWRNPIESIMREAEPHTITLHQ